MPQTREFGDFCEFTQMNRISPAHVMQHLVRNTNPHVQQVRPPADVLHQQTHAAAKRNAVTVSYGDSDYGDRMTLADG